MCSSRSRKTNSCRVSALRESERRNPTQFRVPYEAKPGGCILVPLPSSSAPQRYPQHQQYYTQSGYPQQHNKHEHKHEHKHELAKGALLGMGAFMLGDALF